jgi:hypothetical protein
MYMKHSILTMRRLELLQSKILHIFQLTNSMTTCGLKANSWKKMYEDWTRVQDEMLYTIKKNTEKKMIVTCTCVKQSILVVRMLMQHFEDYFKCFWPLKTGKTLSFVRSLTFNKRSVKNSIMKQHIYSSI